MKSNPAAIPTQTTPWQELIVVCAKCSKKLDGGFGPDGDDSLGRAVKRALRTGPARRTVRVVEAKCLGLCPKGCVTVLFGSRPGEMLAVPRGTDPAALLLRYLP